MAIKAGSYVEYKGTTYMVVGHANGLVKIINPLVGNAKRQVKPCNLVILSFTPALTISLKGAEYLVTTKGIIISLTTGRLMKWADDNGNRITLLALAKARQPK